VVLPIHQILVLAVGLGMDVMAVCIGVGVAWHGPRQKLRLAWHMGLFQFLMPILGWLAGRQLAGMLREFGGYVAAGLLFAVGAKMLYEAIRARPGAVAEGTDRFVEKQLHVKRGDPTRGWSLVALSLATSIDALLAGVSLGLRESAIWTASVITGLVAALMALIGVIIGQRAGKALGRPAEIAGALVLMALAVSLLCV